MNTQPKLSVHMPEITYRSFLYTELCSQWGDLKSETYIKISHTHIMCICIFFNLFIFGGGGGGGGGGASANNKLHIRGHG